MCRDRPLRELIKEKTVDQTKAFDIASQIAPALQAAHKLGIVHRDIKPEHTMVLDDGFVKILDIPTRQTDSEREYGFIRDFAGNNSRFDHYHFSSYVTQQVRGEEVDATDLDIWSLSVVLYEMLTGGERPFTGKTSSDIRPAILRDEPPLDVFSPRARALFEKSL